MPDDVSRETTVPTGLRLALGLAFLVLGVSGLLVLIDRQIKNDLVRQAQELRRTLEEHDATSSRPRVPGTSGVGGLEPSPGASADTHANGRLAPGPGGLAGRSPGDRSGGDES
jgi:hypothetical protein